MRPIDADALEEVVQTSLRENPHKDGRARAFHNTEYMHFLDAIRRIPTIPLPPSTPLTLEELREMDGEPVHLDLGDGGEWALGRAQQGKVFFTHKNTICAPANILFECGGKAYRRRPEEGTHEH